MHTGTTTLSQFLTDPLHRGPHDTDLAALLLEVAAAVQRIAAMAAQGALGDAAGAAELDNHQGEAQQKLDLLAHEVMVQHGLRSGLLAGMVSEELPAPCEMPAAARRGPLLLLFDPLDGSSNADVNVSVGTIFSVLRREGDEAPAEQDFLRPGREQVAAGYAIYGPSTMLVLTVGAGVHGFTLDPANAQFVLTHPDLRVPETTSEFAINASNERFWEPPVARYVGECKAGRAGVRERDFNLRWIASMVAEVHRILIRGGVFMYPLDRKQPPKPGRLRLMYEANPMGLLIEQAGGLASTGRERLLDVVPAELHQRVPVLLGSRCEIERLERYHAEHDLGTDEAFVSPLFNERSLYRPEFTASVHA